MSIPSLILYSAPVIKVTPLTIGNRALCSSNSTQDYEKDEEYEYGGLD